MSNIDEEISKTILLRTLKQMKKDPPSNIGCTVGLPDHSDIYTWKCTLVGPEDSPYKGGIFQLYIKFKKNFPMEGPEVIFDTPIYHMNINPVAGNQPLGHCCVSTVNFWTPDTSIEDLLTSIFGLFYVANEEGAYGLDYKAEFRNNRNLYDKKAEYFTKKYAMGDITSSKESNLTKWTFDIGDDFYQMK